MWFGWMDNDVFLSHQLVDVIRHGSKNNNFIRFKDNNIQESNYSWGPISAYELKSFRKYVFPILIRDKKELKFMFENSQTYYNFDENGEWGRTRSGTYRNSMSRVVKEAADSNKNNYNSSDILQV